MRKEPWPGVEPRTFLLQGNSATNCTNVEPIFIDVSVELPFILMHPKPVELPASRPQSAVPDTDPPIDTNLIEFETNSVSQDDDFVFEDFARLRLKGVVDDKDEDC
ncbi:hypothetical protein ATANTOWER_019447 [Ataeniobius toweri]|uniref:Uncharacterized protein n=1 Tax=Ataeniobius toweri TaxID=208326 RepID=A0ABU7CBS5_9TELE|nr:hypothetical protein [Ataeniobius toweri]